MSSSSEWEVVIGLEVHVQLHTRAKVFASSSWGFGQEPNEQVDPVVLGLPGTLPVVNREAVEKSILFGLVVGAEIGRTTSIQTTRRTISSPKRISRSSSAALSKSSCLVRPAM